MSPTAPAAGTPDKSTALTSLGFLTVLNEANGYVGGYLVTNTWGRPLEFRLSSAVQPNRVQQILYAGTLLPYICADLIGKTLVDKTALPVQLIMTDREAVLDLRQRVETPVVWLAPAEDEPAAGSAHGENLVAAATAGRGALFHHPRFPADGPVARHRLSHLTGLDLAEPFARIREAIGEARRMGVGK